MADAFKHLLVELEAKSDDALFLELGEITSTHVLDIAETPEELGLDVGQSMQELGHALFQRMNREMYKLCCGDAKEDTKERKTLLKALHLDRTALAATISGLFVTSFGLNVAVAAILSILLVRHIFLPAGDELCKFWVTRLK